MPAERTERPVEPQETSSSESQGWRTPSVSTAGGGHADLIRLLMAVYRYKWIVVLALVIGIAAGVVTIRFIRPQYQAQGTVWIEASDRQTGNQGPIRQAELLESFAWIELLKSFTVLDYVVTELHLFLSTRAPEDRALLADFKLKERFHPGSYRFEVASDLSGFLLSTVEGAPIQRGSIGGQVGDTVGFDWTPPAAVWTPGRVIEFTVNIPRDVALGLQESLQTGLAEKGQFLSLSLRGSDREQVTRTLNVLMDRFVEVASNLKKAKAVELTRILDQQRQVAESNLKAAEIGLEGFRVQTITQPTLQGAPVAGGLQETRDPVYSNFFQMKISLEDLRRDRLALDNIMKEVGSGILALDALVSVPAAAKSAVLTKLLDDLNEDKAELRVRQARYTSEDQLVKRHLAAVTNLEQVFIPAAVRELEAQLAANERELSQRVESASSELKAIPPRLIEEARYDRQVQSATTLHNNLSVRYEEARLAALSSVPDIAIIDDAKVPFAPVQDKRPLVVAGMAGGAVALALLAIFLLDRSDRRVRFPHQITDGMGLPILGAVPRVKGGLAARDRDSSVQMQEAFRELRLAIGHAYGAAGPVVLSVTSSETGDGKSTVAGSLAEVFASQGYKVILVDGDIRRGDLHRSLGVRRAPGLTDFLAGRAQLDDVLQPTERGFTLIGSGTRMQTGPELLGTMSMAQLIRTLRSAYTVVIIDTPPLGAGVDAYVLGTATGNMILVVRTGRTDGELAEAKLTLLDRLPIRILGAVLNDVPPSRLYRHYSYLQGYQAEDEVDGPLQVAGIANGNGDSSAG